MDRARRARTPDGPLILAHHLPSVRSRSRHPKVHDPVGIAWHRALSSLTWRPSLRSPHPCIDCGGEQDRCGLILRTNRSLPARSEFSVRSGVRVHRTRSFRWVPLV
eukprot:4741974-Pleurochrysis_carterae.AAC.1